MSPLWIGDHRKQNSPRRTTGVVYHVSEVCDTQKKRALTPQYNP